MLFPCLFLAPFLHGIVFIYRKKLKKGDIETKLGIFLFSYQITPQTIMGETKLGIDHGGNEPTMSTTKKS